MTGFRPWFCAIAAMAVASELEVANADARLLAPASLAPVASALEAAFPPDQGTLTVILGPTSQLVPQAERGLAAEALITADSAWMDYAVEHSTVVAESRRIFARNVLVLGSRQLHPEIRTLADLEDALAAGGKVALCGPAPVPCGTYARSALDAVGILPAVEPRIVFAKDATAVRMWTASGVVDFGILYRTDAIASPEIRFALDIDPMLSGAVVYEAARLTAASQTAGDSLLAFLTSADARQILAAHGFAVPDGSK